MAMSKVNFSTFSRNLQPNKHIKNLPFESCQNLQTPSIKWNHLKTEKAAIGNLLGMAGKLTLIPWFSNFPDVYGVRLTIRWFQSITRSQGFNCANEIAYFNWKRFRAQYQSVLFVKTSLGWSVSIYKLWILYTTAPEFPELNNHKLKPASVWTVHWVFKRTVEIRASISFSWR